MSETRWPLSIVLSVLPLAMSVLAGCSSVPEITGVPKFLGGNGLTRTAIDDAPSEGLPGFTFNNQPLGNNTAIHPSSIGTQGLSNFN